MITVGELDAKTRADRAYRERLYADGLCVRCGRQRETETKRCRRCTAKASEQTWRRRQREAPKAHGPQPKARWNFGTDAAIIEHMKLARWLAWRIAVKSGLARDIDDLIGDAFLGLVRAGRTYDEMAGTQFATWARPHVLGAVWDGIRRRDEMRRRIGQQCQLSA